MATKGKLIVIEGTDGSGKATQSKLLVDRLVKQGLAVQTLVLPQYGKKSAGPIEEYLAGKYGKANEITPYEASVLFAVDHFDAAREIKKMLSHGFVVVMDRYVDSNAGHQGGKLGESRDRERFWRWLYDFEYGLLGIPKPDIVVFLHVPAAVAQKLAEARAKQAGKKLDLHEADMEHLRKAEEAYLQLINLYLHDHKLIECVSDGELRSPEDIHKDVWQEVQRIIAS